MISISTHEIRLSQLQGGEGAEAKGGEAGMLIFGRGGGADARQGEEKWGCHDYSSHTCNQTGPAEGKDPYRIGFYFLVYIRLCRDFIL